MQHRAGYDGHDAATQGYVTAIHDDLVALPAPKDQIAVAVYKFRDQTGQYKTSSQATTFSTAVTQGATSMLIQALKESGWFLVIEREALTNLLNERKIIRSARAEYASQPGVQAPVLPALPPMPPMLYAGVLLEGGIIGYDTNLVVGAPDCGTSASGARARFARTRSPCICGSFPCKTAGCSNPFRRASPSCREVDFGIYRFVRVKRLLEVETGLSTNEPPTMAVLEAIEKAVYDLIIQGILDGVWQLKNPDDMKCPAIQNYLAERQQREKATFDKHGNLVKVETDANPAPGAAPKKTEGPTPGKIDGTPPAESPAGTPRRAAAEGEKHARWTPPRFPWTYLQDLPSF